MGWVFLWCGSLYVVLYALLKCGALGTAIASLYIVGLVISWGCSWWFTGCSRHLLLIIIFVCHCLGLGDGYAWWSNRLCIVGLLRC